MCAASVFGTNHYQYFKTIGGLNHANTGIRGGQNGSGDLLRYARNARRVPQVVFHRVKSGYCSGFIGLSAQLNYVLGKAERVIDPNGEFDGQRLIEQADSQSLASKWADGWNKNTQNGKHTMHLVASFPANTSVAAVECIVRETCEELLSQGQSRFDYIAAIHTDTLNPHAHIIVNRRNTEGEWFYLAQDGEFNYDRFKETLVKHGLTYGVELNNSSRLSRGVGDYHLDTQNQAIRGLEGAVLDFGSAKYKHKEDGSDSFYVSLKTKFGERTIWGVGLAGVLDSSGAERGDTIRIRHEGKRSVQVEAKDGKLIKTHRNDWRIDFKGQEYGSFDSEDAETPTLNEQAVADKRAEIIMAEASRYRRFADMLKGTHLALSLAFKAASESLFAGEALETINTIKEDAMSDQDVSTDYQNLYQAIETAREKLQAVWEKLPEIADSERPHMEERYFGALGDMDRLLVGERRREFDLKAEGSIYADEYRHKLAHKLPQRAVGRLEQYGISRDEFMARTNIEACSHTLETHWIERDAQTIAAHMDLDMQSEAGKDEAFRRVNEFYSEIIQDISETDMDTEAEWARFHDLRTQFETAGWDYKRLPDGEKRIEARNSVNDALASFESFAEKSPLHAELASVALEDSTPKYRFAEGFVPADRREIINVVAASLNLDMSSREGREHAYNQFEQHFTLPIEHEQLWPDELLHGDHETLQRVRDLSQKDKLSFEESKVLIQGLEHILGSERLNELQSGNPDLLAGLNIDARETLGIARSYCDAMRQHGHDMETSEQALRFETYLLDAKDKIVGLSDGREAAPDRVETIYQDGEDFISNISHDFEQQLVLSDERKYTQDKILDLVKKDTRSFEESRDLIDELGDALGKEGMKDLQNANPDAFKKVGFDIGSRETLAIAKSYCDAMREHGYNTDASEQAIFRESALLDVKDKLAVLEDEHKRGEEAHRQSLNEKETYGL